MRKKTPLPDEENVLHQDVLNIVSYSPQKLQFIICGKPKSANQLLGQNWFKRKKNADLFNDTIRYLILNKQNVTNVKLRKIKHVKICAIIYRSQYMDFDGAVSTLKPIVDGLKGLVIEDDSWELTGPWLIDQKKCQRGKEKVVLQIEEVI